MWNQQVIKIGMGISLMAVMGLTSCHQAHSVSEGATSTTAEISSAPVFQERDKKFLAEVVEINLEEIMLGKLAQQRASQDEIRSFAKMLEEDHRLAKSSLTELAMSKTFPLPYATSSKATAMYDRLNENAVDAFDEAYITLLIETHQHAIECFKTYLNGDPYPDLQPWARTWLEHLTSHLEQARAIQAGERPIS